MVEVRVLITQIDIDLQIEKCFKQFLFYIIRVVVVGNIPLDDWRASRRLVVGFYCYAR